MSKIRPIISSIMMALVITCLTGCFGLVKQAGAVSGMAGKTVIIDPGHGGEDLGCSDANNSCYEKDITLAVAMELAQLLEQDGANVKLTRDIKETRNFISLRKFIPPWKKSQDSLDERVEFVKKNNADLLVSLHVSSFSNRNKAGAVAYCKEGSQSGNILAQCVQTELRKIPEMSKRTARGRNYYLLDRLDIPAIVVELGYLSNIQEQQCLISPEYNKKLARSICTGLLNYYSAPINASNTSLQRSSQKEITEAEHQFNMKTISDNLKKISDGGDTEKLALTKMETLFNGPAQTQSFNSELSRGLYLKHFNLSGPLAAIDLGIRKEDSFISSDEEWNDIAIIAGSLFDIPEVKAIKFTVNGQPAKTLAGHIDISEPISRDKLPLTKIANGVMEGKKPRVAIVIDDFGPQKIKGLEEILALGCPLTAAVMPNLEKTQEHAQRASELGYAVIIHLPMEPMSANSSWLGPGAVTSKLSPEKIREIVRQDLSQAPYAIGFNNHMGSLATSKEEIVRPVLEVAREKNFFVLDSRTTDKTVLGSMAKEMGIPCAKRDVFLDNKRDLKYIKEQLNLLSELAIKNGSAIGIGHVRINTAQAIKEMRPVMEEKGIEFVYLSELVH